MQIRRADFSLDEEHRALRQAFAALLARECPTERVRASEPVGFDDKLWAEFVEMRAAAMGVPDENGGDGAGLLELVLVAEEVGRSVAPVPFVETATAARLLARCGAAAASLCSDVVEGSTVATLALHPMSPGRPQLVPAGAAADAIVASVGGRLVALRRPAPFEHVANHGYAPLARVDLDDPRIEVTELLSGPDAVSAFEVAVREWKLLMAAAQVGIAAAALPIAVDFASNRMAFGVPIATYQAIAHPLADCYIGVLGARRLVWQAAWFADHEPSTQRQLIPMAFANACRVAMQTATTGVHTQGGLGFTIESDMQLYFRRAKGWANVGGDPAGELQAIATELYGPARTG